jgi:hypothetical protein
MKTKFYSMYAICEDSKGVKHTVTVVGKLEQTRERQMVQEVVPVEVKEGSFVDGVLTYPSNKLLNRKLTLGVSICHPSDTFDEQIGIDIAKGRINSGQDLGQLETSNVTMLTEDAIMSEILVKLNHICQNIDEYISE